TSVEWVAPLERQICTPRRFSSFWVARDSEAGVSTHSSSWLPKPAAAADWLTAGGMADEVIASCKVARSGNFKIMDWMPWAGVVSDPGFAPAAGLGVRWSRGSPVGFP